MSRFLTPLFWLIMLAGLVPTGLRLLRPQAVESATQTERPAIVAKPIRDVRLGERVVGRNPIGTDAQRNEPEPDPVTWRKVVFRMDKPGGERIDFELLWPRDRIKQSGAAPGKSLHLDMAELNGVGIAEVLVIEPCPPIVPGSGSVVVGKFVHRVHRIIDLKTDGGHIIGTTPNHPFWCSR